MAKTTGISWARSTRNFWVGCTKVGPGCDGCYAETFQRWIQGKDPESGEAKNWGPGRPRIPFIGTAVADLKLWNRAADKESATWVNRWRADQPPGYWPVFINSQSDVFDNEVPAEWRAMVFSTIEECPHLTFFLVTKRIGNVPDMVPADWMRDGFPPNVRLIITVVNQEEADRDVPKLLSLPCKNGISYEPALGPVDWQRFFRPLLCRLEWEGRGIDWIIIGGESEQAGHKARPFVLGWAKDTIRQCKAAGVPPFFKQAGSNATNREGVRHPFKDRAGADPLEWPEDLHVQEFPQ